MSASNAQTTVVVTGATGYVAGAIIDLLVRRGYQVRGTVRSLQNAKTRKLVADFPSVQLFEADLLIKGSFVEAISGARYVLHTASPVVLAPTDAVKQLIEPAVQGTAEVISTALATPSVQRIVLTSSCVNFMDKDHPDGRRYTDDDWNDHTDLSNPYQHSKVLAEKKAWDLVDAHNAQDRKHPVCLIAILPSLVIGPPIGSQVDAYSVETVVNLFNGSQLQDGVMGARFADVDIREVAAAHVAAIEKEGAQGRYIVSNGPSATPLDYAAILQPLYPQTMFPSKVNAYGWWFHTFVTDNAKSRRELGLTYSVPQEQSIRETAAKLLQLGVIKADGSAAGKLGGPSATKASH